MLSAHTGDMSDQELSEEEFEVEAIIAEKILRGRIHYNIKWKGYDDPSDNTWEPLEKLTHCPDVLAEWQRKRTSKTPLSKSPKKQRAKPKPRTSISAKPKSTSTPAAPAPSTASRKSIPKPPSNPPPASKPVPSIAPRPGTEKWEIHLSKAEFKTTVVNTVDDAGPPAQFSWTEKLIHSGAPPPDPETLVGCGCGGVCSPPFCGCTMEENPEGEALYDAHGRLTIRGGGKPIYECNSRCSCGPNCGNRVVQKGRKIPLEIYRTVGRGWGVRSPVEVPKGTFITQVKILSSHHPKSRSRLLTFTTFGMTLLQYMGELITSDEAETRGSVYEEEGLTFLFDVDFHCDHSNQEESDFTVDARYYGNVGRFLNHSCNPNCAIYPVALDSWSPSYFALGVFAEKAIKPGEELTFSYGGSHIPHSEPSLRNFGNDDEDESWGRATSKKGGRRKRCRGKQDDADDGVHSNTEGGSQKKRQVEKNGNGRPKREAAIRGSMANKVLGALGAAYAAGGFESDDAGKRKPCLCGAKKCRGFMPFTNAD
ncbi:hypothetical protein HK104_009712 [Borealophlyctis nickersoniae]|nr:hypothetical protein HK104_009712 [Borealophlyctis nickersoniae]